MSDQENDTLKDDGLVPGSFGAGPSGTGPSGTGPSDGVLLNGPYGEEDYLEFHLPAVLAFPEGTPDAVKKKVMALIDGFTPWNAEWRSDKQVILVDADEDPEEAKEMCETFESILSLVGGWHE